MREKVRFEDGLAYQVQFTARLLRKHFLDLAAAEGLELTPEQWVVLNKLTWRGQCTLSELVPGALADRPNVSRIVEGLVKRGLVARRADEHDGRKVRLCLTKQGQQVHDRFEALVPKARKQLMRGLTEDELVVAMRVLGRLAQNLE
ncbi:MAG: MarR family transcriptional regulator [Deltaproteobacteria bacterium]|jgi:MarR family transcriptional regulator for hemolysin|nr:MarR family transcriptional regulator [Deltaproteobacteria bacterium]